MTGPAELRCRACGGDVLFVVRVRTRLAWVEGVRVPGARTVTLCPRCHRDDPPAQGVLAFFAVHERITHETMHEAGAVIRDWIARVLENPPTYTDEDLEDDIRRWTAGEM